MNKPIKILMDVPSKAEYLKLLRDTVESILSKKKNININIISEIKVALTESCSNIIKHTDTTYDNPSIRVEFILYESLLRIHVNYKDKSFAPETVAPPDLNNLSESGFGIYIMKNIMDKCEYIKNEGTGEIMVILEKRL